MKILDWYTFENILQHDHIAWHSTITCSGAKWVIWRFSHRTELSQRWLNGPRTQTGATFGFKFLESTSNSILKLRYTHYIYTCINMNKIYSVFLNFLCYETHEYIFKVLGTFGFQILITAKRNGNAADIAVDLFELWPYPC